MGYSHIFCIIDMDTKDKEPEHSQYIRLKAKFAEPINKPRKGIYCKVEFFETHRCTELFFLYYFRYTSRPYDEQEPLLKPTADSVAFVNHSNDGDFDIPLKWQSKGTIKYIRILDALYDMITSSHVYYLDELGEDLHNDLLYYYLNVFLFNSDKSQLIITSQETTLLSQDLINENRGVVWFVEKNKETASSEYSRGDSFGLHKNLSLYNSYRIGRLGAKPELGSIFINLED